MSADDLLADLDFETPKQVVCECPACYAHPGRPCPLYAVWTTRLHEIHGCDKPDLDHGAAIRLLCEQCLGWHRKRAEELAERARVVYAVTGNILVCRVCHVGLTDVNSYLHVEAFDGL